MQLDILHFDTKTHLLASTGVHIAVDYRFALGLAVHLSAEI